ncbi:MAG: hypothetical protein A2283_23795 [Lentisphaerae bacterium RIFOXYA12_FULL_48_11]|nr:MAG: hypothetical protein A2283_23795 [Lentisphaerae bacterium RIFOXYA12_FULL_48_11]
MRGKALGSCFFWPGIYVVLGKINDVRMLFRLVLFVVIFLGIDVLICETIGLRSAILDLFLVQHV